MQGEHWYINAQSIYKIPSGLNNVIKPEKLEHHCELLGLERMIGVKLFCITFVANWYSELDQV